MFGVWRKIYGLDVEIVAFQFMGKSVLVLMSLLDFRFIWCSYAPNIDFRSLEVLRSSSQNLSIWRKFQTLKGMVALIFEEEFLLV